jgi:hypothetical protein
MCVGVSAMGYSNKPMILNGITFFMSVGAHYFETMNQSLTLQWMTKEKTPHFMGNMIALTSLASILSYSSVWILTSLLKLDYKIIYMLAGRMGLLLIFFFIIYFPSFDTKTEQTKKMIFRKHFGFIMF